MTKLIIVIGTSKWTKKTPQQNKGLMDPYKLTLTMFKITKRELMAQSSKQMCIILRIVRILSPTNNFPANSTPREGVVVKSMWLTRMHMGVCVSLCVPFHGHELQLSTAYVNISKVSPF